MMISYMTRLGFMVMPVLGLFKGGERVLPLKSYIPYSVLNLLSYLATYLYQFLALFYAIILNVTFDCLVYSFTIQACAQIELMCCQLMDSLKNRRCFFPARSRKQTPRSCQASFTREHSDKENMSVWSVMIFFFSLLIVYISIFLLSNVSQERYFIYF